MELGFVDRASTRGRDANLTGGKTVWTRKLYLKTLYLIGTKLRAFFFKRTHKIFSKLANLKYLYLKLIARKK